MSKEDTPLDNVEPIAEQDSPKRGGRLALILSLLALSALGAVLWIGYPHWQSLRQDMLSMQQRIQDTLVIQSELKNSLEDTRKLTQGALVNDQQAALIAQQQLLSKTRTAMEQREIELRATIAELRKRTGKPDNRWMVAEAEYLLQLSHARLKLAGDITTAIAAIQQAQQRLLETGDGQWSDIQDLLARDVDTLRAVQLPDLKQLSTDIDTLSAMIPSLQPAYRTSITRISSTEADARLVDGSSNKGWQSAIKTFATNISDGIRIRRHDQAPEALLAPEQEQLLYQNLELILESTRLTLQQKNTQLFSINLQRAGEWISNRFNSKQATAVSMLKTLELLAQVDLNPTLPDISPTLQALQTRKIILSKQTRDFPDQP